MKLHQNNFKRLTIFVTALYCLTFSIVAAEGYYDDSAHWPPFVKLTKPHQLDSGKELPVGRNGVLIRMEKSDSGEETLLIDYGSDGGVQKVSPDKTDIAVRVAEYQTKIKVKEFPNWTMMLGRGIAKIMPNDLKGSSLKDLLPYKYMLLVYDEDLSIDGSGLFYGQIAENQKALEDHSVMVVVLPVSDELLLKAAQDIVDICTHYEMELFYIYPYLSRAYVKSLYHNASSYPSCVLTDVEGKTLSSVENPLKNKNWLKDFIGIIDAIE